ncbi:CDC73-domain-containing protein [Microstroma glucosiphilum]|uniref:CDC73-domain-containing protein n=1 Tax=Pseudomicrostroma glucosiphilum TaxID=1684307 RepID=A0A316UAC5_9BASI|nr:CDC73-domain-containing protein [Pseudomicrostroma glucosiphilum]PWN21363.1 CDC73-domain-containing protein [Pseudomicrostroma glucosiphilum]
MAASSSSSAEVAVEVADPLVLLLQHAASLPDLTYTDSSGNPTSDLLTSSFIHFPSQPSAPIARGTRTRVVRSRNSVALQRSSASTPEAPQEGQEDDFMPLDALVFLLQTQGDAAGIYVAKATRERVARVEILDRPSLLDLLLGKKTESQCEVVLSQEECAARNRRREAGAAAAAPASGQEAVTGEQGDAGISDASLVAISAGLHPLLSTSKRPYIASKQDQAFVKRLRASEVVLRDRTWAFRCVKPSSGGGADDDEQAERANGGGVATVMNGKTPVSKDVDFTGLRRSAMGRVAAVRKGAAPGAPSTSSAKGPVPTAPPASNLGRSAKHRRLDPIIILPSSPSSLLTLANIKLFLEEGQYVPAGSSSMLAPTGGSNEVVVINRPKGGRFLAIDSLDALNRLGASRDGTGSDPWKRVVCVVTTGQKWQFRGYRWEEGRELFKNVFGLYAYYKNSPKDPNVREWNVTELPLEQDKRHHDRQVSAHFWRQLEGWIQRKKPELA